MSRSAIRKDAIMKHKRVPRSCWLNVALLAVIAVSVIAPLFAPDDVAYAQTVYNTYAVAVTEAINVTTPENAIGMWTGTCDAQINNSGGSAGSWLTLDFGQVYSGISQLRIFGYTATDLKYYNIYVSLDGVDWSYVNQIGSQLKNCYDPKITPLESASFRYVKILEGNNAAFRIDTVEIYYSETLPMTPTPFATVTPLPARPTACVTVTPVPSSTPPRTPTPFVLTPWPTSTATTTPTLGGPTATPSPTPTGTPGPSFDTGYIKFEQSLSPWTVGDSPPVSTTVLTTSWLNVAGMDSSLGVAQIGDSMAILYNDDVEDAGEGTIRREQIYDALVFSNPTSFTLPFRVIGIAKWSRPIPEGRHVYLNLWYYDTSITDSFKWVREKRTTLKRKEQSDTWNAFDFVVSVPVTSVIGLSDNPNIVAIALAPSVSNPAGTGTMLVDNLRIYSGPLAVAASYPVCQGTGVTGKPPVAIKQCKIRFVGVNVYAGCTAPKDTLDIAGWIGYYFCRLWKYFWFSGDNRAQITGILDRQNSNEPIGTLNEMPDSLNALYETASSILNVYSRNDYYTVDWSTLFAGWTVDLSNITKDWRTTPDPIDEQAFLNSCPATIANMSKETQRSACFVIWVLKMKLRFWVFLQYALDATAIIYALATVIEWLAQHG